jgi:hypothetical protein
MRASIRGWKRDHGRTILFDEELEKIDSEDDVSTYPWDEAVLENEKDEDQRTEYIEFTRRIRVTMNGDYMFQLRFTPADIIYLFWLSFRDRALRVLSKAFSKYDQQFNGR